MLFEDYSVLMATYYKEEPAFLDAAINSIVSQTKKTNDFVIVCDGPLGKELNDVLEYYSSRYKYITIIRLSENHGVGFASQKGLQNIKNEVLAKMDSDDISLPDRMEKELAKINEGFDLVSGSIAEFEEDPNNPHSVKVMPQNQEQIIRYSKKRNPFCNVATMFKKSMIEQVGGFSDMNVAEDYTLGIKLIQAGARCYNFPDVLVNVRADKKQIARRSGRELFRNLKKLRKYMLDTKYISRHQYNLYNFESWVFCYSPSWIKRLLYKMFLRK